MSSAITDATGSTIWRRGWCIFVLLSFGGPKTHSGLVTGCTKDLAGRFGWGDEFPWGTSDSRGSGKICVGADAAAAVLYSVKWPGGPNRSTSSCLLHSLARPEGL